MRSRIVRRVRRVAGGSVGRCRLLDNGRAALQLLIRDDMPCYTSRGQRSARCRCQECAPRWLLIAPLGRNRPASRTFADRPVAISPRPRAGGPRRRRVHHRPYSVTWTGAVRPERASRVPWPGGGSSRPSPRSPGSRPRRSTGLSKVPFELGVTHYDEPPPDGIDDLRGDPDDATGSARRTSSRPASRSTTAGSSTTGTSARAASGPRRSASGPRRCRSPRSSCPTSRPEPRSARRSVRFVQTAGGRMGLPTPRRVSGKPFVQCWPSIAWTTLALTINADGTSSHELVGASPFPRHWIYDDGGRLVGEVRRSSTSRKWYRDSFGEHRRGATQDSPAVLRRGRDRAGARRSRARSCAAARSRRSGRSPPARRSCDRATPGTEVFLDPRRDARGRGRRRGVAEIGPGAVLGERAPLEDGIRSATLRAELHQGAGWPRWQELTELDHDDLGELATTHRARSDRPPGTIPAEHDGAKPGTHQRDVIHQWRPTRPRFATITSGT